MCSLLETYAAVNGERMDELDVLNFVQAKISLPPTPSWVIFNEVELLKADVLNNCKYPGLHELDGICQKHATYLQDKCLEFCDLKPMSDFRKYRCLQTIGCLDKSEICAAKALSFAPFEKRYATLA